MHFKVSGSCQSPDLTSEAEPQTSDPDTKNLKTNSPKTFISLMYQAKSEISLIRRIRSLN